MKFPVPANEEKRLEALRQYGILDTAPQQSFDDFAGLASHICGTPIALMSLVDADRQWFKAKVGLTVSETPRSDAFCAHAIMSDHVMIVEDATLDARFSTNPLVTAGPRIRFYAGAPLMDRKGFALGSLCVIDREPRHLSEAQEHALEALARQIVMQLEYRKISAELAASLAEVKTLGGLLPMCGYCKNIRNDDGYWKSVEDYLSSHSDASLSHGICPICAEQMLKDFRASAALS